MLVDDRPRYPMAFIVQLQLSGCLDKQALEAAVEVALDRHPLMTAIIGPGKQGKDCWIKAPNPQPQIDWGDLDKSIEFVDGEYLDIRKEVGLRIFIRFDQQQTQITAQVHHAACDGIGSYHFFGDVLHEYAIQTSESTLEPHCELDPNRLRVRGRASYDMNNFRLPDGSYLKTWDLTLKHVAQFNALLKPEKRKPASFQRPFPGVQSYVFGKSEHKKLRLAAQSRGQVINDMLVEKLFETLHLWHHSHQKSWFRKNVSVMMPLNLREQGDNDISACNIVAHAFVRRTWEEMQDRETFRQKLAHELLQIKHERHKVKFMHMMAGGHYFYPRTMKATLDWKRSMATAILSNTGDPTRQFHADFPRENGKVRCGNMVLEDISGVPPLRPGTNATISIFTYRRELTICIRCDPNQFSESDTRELLESYIAKMKLEINS